MRIHLMMLAGMLALSAPALAEGPGTYNSVRSDGSVEAVALLAKTSDQTWTITMSMGQNSVSGYGVGNDKYLAFNVATPKGPVVLLYVANGKGGYDGISRFATSTETNEEYLVPR